MNILIKNNEKKEMPKKGKQIKKDPNYYYKKVRVKGHTKKTSKGKKVKVDSYHRNQLYKNGIQQRKNKERSRKLSTFLLTHRK